VRPDCAGPDVSGGFNVVTPPQGRPLEGLRILVVEDEYAVAADLTWWLEDGGAQVVGPAPTIEDALILIEAHGAALDRAMLDVNLRGEKVFPVADALMKLAVPIVFCTGYEDAVLPRAFAGAARLTKPLDHTALFAALASTSKEDRLAT
jgi:CheY-like chemotaxis protein